jgi:hypothetical protein
MFPRNSNPGFWNEVRPSSDVLACLSHLESQALREVHTLRKWRRSGAENEPVDLIVNAFVRGEEWFKQKAPVLGDDRITRLQWRGMPEKWWTSSRIAAETRDDAVQAWLQISENVAYEMKRIQGDRAFAISLASMAVAAVALGVAALSLIVQLLKYAIG